MTADRSNPGARRGPFPFLRINLLPREATLSDEQLALRLARRLMALPEPAMRGAVLAEQLRSLTVRRGARVVSIIVNRGRAGGPPFDLAMGALEAVLRDERLPYPVLCDLYELLVDDGLGEVAALLLPGRQLQDVLGEQAPRFPGGRDLTLGERKSLARVAPRDLLARLMRDPEPQVIRLLLRNPRLVERDVILIASRRGLGAEVVREIMASPRWISRYPVKRTLALNPSVPETMAIRLLPGLQRNHLKEIAGDPALSQSRQRAAQELLASR